MAEYTYEDVIIDPNDPRVEIGAKYWFSDYPNPLVKRLNNAEASKHGHLSSVKSNGDLPFYDEDSRCWLCIIRKKEPSYEERQAEWVKANNINVGDKVKVIRKAIDYEGGWDNVWDDAMDSGVNEVNEVIDINHKYGIYLDLGDYNFWFPYFILEKVEAPVFKVGDFVREKETGLVGVIIKKEIEEFFVYQSTPKSVFYLFKTEELEPVKAHIEPFNLSDARIRNNIRGCWIKPKDEEEMDECMIVGFQSYEKGLIDLCISCNGFLSPKDALSSWTFIDGSPCGIVVED